MMAMAERLLEVTRQEIARTLAGLCAEVGAAESSVLLPRGASDLFFFASSNAALMQADAPMVPIGTSFSGLAFRTGQTIAFADAAMQPPHFKAVDEMVGKATREFAAIPFSGRTTLGIVTLVNRPGAEAAARPFEIAELRRTEQLARELVQPIAVLSGLMGGAPGDADSLDPDFAAELALLDGRERRIVHGLASALLQNRGE